MNSQSDKSEVERLRKLLNATAAERDNAFARENQLRSRLTEEQYRLRETVGAAETILTAYRSIDGKGAASSSGSLANALSSLSLDSKKNDGVPEKDEVSSVPMPSFSHSRMTRARSVRLEPQPKPRRTWSLDVSGSSKTKTDKPLVNMAKFSFSGRSSAGDSSDGSLSIERPKFARRFPDRIHQIIPEAHAGEIFSITSSHDGNYLATGGDDRKIRIATLLSNVPVEVIDEPVKSVKALEFISDFNSESSSVSPLICAGTSDGTLRLYKRSTKNQGEWDLDRVYPAHSLAVRKILKLQRAPSARLVSVSVDRKVCVTDMHAGRGIFSATAPSSVMDATVFSNGEIITGHRDGEIRVFSPQQTGSDGEGLVMDGIRAHSKAIISLSMLDDGFSVVSLGRDNTLCVSDTRMSLKVVREFETDNLKTNSDWQRLSVDGRAVYCGLGETGGIGVWDSETGKFERKLDCSPNMQRRNVNDLVRRPSATKLSEVLSPLWTHNGQFVCAHRYRQLSFWMS